MVQQKEGDDYVIATGESHSVREFMERAFSYLDLDPYEYLETDPTLYRPAEVVTLHGDAHKAKHRLGWEYALPFQMLVEEMVQADLERESSL